MGEEIVASTTTILIGLVMIVKGDFQFIYILPNGYSKCRRRTDKFAQEQEASGASSFQESFSSSSMPAHPNWCLLSSNKNHL